MENIYDRLRARLDDLANGFPETESKVEIRLLKRLFTEEEAQLYLQMSPFLEKPEDELYQPPQTGAETYMKIMQERGKL